MSVDLILDTDALLWMSGASPSLGRKARTAIEDAAAGGSLRFSAVSMLEIARLHWDGRIDLRKEPGVWHRSLLDLGVHGIPVTSEMAVLAGSLERREDFHADPADQLITAAAILTRRRLVTSDRKILRWAVSRAEPDCLDARS
ncbi:MAG: type II toxin-antitoxin system VapC family toxin [bacterium]|nr:type II toxin-antitoxin system VapC family toxin [bacterium]MDE0287113.1 type II toxin-antitoxin system VapC family toxin [bacterium]MDE0439974.1 type II toxin-antitoxin system VapC family toxin [bacterium]